MTCNFRKQSPGDVSGCSFESHDFTSLALTLAILYPVPFPIPASFTFPHLAHPQTEGEFLRDFFEKSLFLAPVQSLSSELLAHKRPIHGTGPE